MLKQKGIGYHAFSATRSNKREEWLVSETLLANENLGETSELMLSRFSIARLPSAQRSNSALFVCGSEEGNRSAVCTV